MFASPRVRLALVGALVSAAFALACVPPVDEPTPSVDGSTPTPLETLPPGQSLPPSKDIGSPNPPATVRPIATP